MNVVVPIREVTWGRVGESWALAQQKATEALRTAARMKWEAVQAAMDTGAMLIEMNKRSADQKEFVQCAGQEAGLEKSQVYNLMKLAAHRPLLERHRPQS